MEQVRQLVPLQSLHLLLLSSCLQKRAAHAPTFGSVKVPDTMLGRVIGAGGSNLKQLEERWGARVDVDDDGEGVRAAFWQQ